MDKQKEKRLAVHGEIRTPCHDALMQLLHAWTKKLDASSTPLEFPVLCSRFARVGGSISRRTGVKIHSTCKVGDRGDPS